MRIKGVSSILKAPTVNSVKQRQLERVSEDKRQRSSEIHNKEGANSQYVQMDLLIEAVEDTNKALEGYNRRFEISVHEGTNAVMVKVIDNSTEEVIREIPPEKILDMVAALWEMAGIIVDRKI